MAAFFSPNGSLTVNLGAPYFGRDPITEFVRGFLTAFPDLHLVLDELRLQGDHAFYHWTLTGTNTGPGGTGHRVHISGFERWKLGTEGLIAESIGTFDEVLFQQQLKTGL